MSDEKKQTEDELLNEVTSSEYKYGFTTDIESDTIPKGISEDVIRIISAKKKEPKWMLEFRLNAYKVWLEMDEPDWANVSYKKPNYNDVIYYSAPKQKPVLDSIDDLDPEMKKTFDKLATTSISFLFVSNFICYITVLLCCSPCFYIYRNQNC